MLVPASHFIDTGDHRPNLVATALACVLREAAGILYAPFDRPPPRA